MNNCWAVTLGNCSDKMTREHLVSAAIFSGEQVDVQGFGWCKERPKRIGLANLTAKILCKRHNEDLSEIDYAGAAAFKILRKADSLLTVRSNIGKRFWNIKRFPIDGTRFERWFLKTLINISFGREFPIGEKAPSAGCPSEQLVHVAYGKQPFQGRAGLYTVAHVGQQLVTADVVKFAPLVAYQEPLYLVGGLFVFRGIRFLLYLGTEGPPERLSGVVLENEHWGLSDLQYHNREIRMEIDGHLSHVVEVRW